MGCLGVFSMGLSGCGKGKSAGGDSGKPVVVLPGPRAKEASANAPTVDTKVKAKPETRKSSIPANADPHNVFLLTEIGESMEVESVQATLATDQFELTMANPELTSTNFVVGAIQQSGQSTPLIGHGKPDPKFTLPIGFAPVNEWGYSDQGLPNAHPVRENENNFGIGPVGNGDRRFRRRTR